MVLKQQREKIERRFLALARAVTVGAAFVCASPIPGLTSSFVAIFTSLLPFDSIVASARPPVTPQEWRHLIDVLRPRILSTASTLIQGVVVGAAFGVLAVLGLPYAVGAVLTSGLAYVWAFNTPHVISTYVALISGLAIFERLAMLDTVYTASIAREIAGVIASSGSGTFLALIAGWGVGIASGSATRLLLSRPYRSLRSAAYDPPLMNKPFNEVLRVGESALLVSLRVEEGAPIAFHSLADSRLKEEWSATVLMIRRGQEEIVLPAGGAVVLPGDELLLLAGKEQVADLTRRFQTPRQAVTDRVE